MMTKNTTDTILACSTFFASKQASTLAGHKQASKPSLAKLFFNPFILIFFSLALSMCSSGGGGSSPSCDVNTLEADCDGDGIDNEDELACGTDPKDPTSFGNSTDCDGDGVSDDAEFICGTDPKDPTSTIAGNIIDCDGDGVENTTDVDDDNDGLIEIQTLAQLHAMRTDLDGDGRTDTGVEADPNLLGNTGCLDNACKGYELGQTLNFDENGDGDLNDTYNQPDSTTWQWNFFEGTDTFTCTFEQSAGTPIARWSFMNGCNANDDIVHGSPSLESFSNCDGLFVGGLTNPSATPPERSSMVSIDRSKLPLSSFFSPSTPRISCSHEGHTIFNHDFSVFSVLSDFPLFSNFSETCEDSTNDDPQPTGGEANSSYSIKTAPCDTSTYKVNRFRGIFERNGFEIKWK